MNLQLRLAICALLIGLSAATTVPPKIDKCALVRCRACDPCPDGHEPDSTAAEPKSQCCWCRPCVPKLTVDISCAAVLCLPCEPCPDGKQMDPAAVRPKGQCCWCPPCTPIKREPCQFICMIACFCPEGQVADPNAVRPEGNCCWCPQCIPAIPEPC